MTHGAVTAWRWWLLALAVGAALLLYPLTGSGQSGYALISGPLEAESGGISCYFNIGHAEHAFGLAPHPDGVACVRLKEFTGRAGTLFWIPD